MSDKSEKNTGLIMKYFILKPEGSDEYARASRLAMITYAESIESNNKQLANDLLGWIDRLQEQRVESLENSTNPDK